jgi:hypothetical protein
MYRSVTSDPHMIAQLGKSFQELTLNFQKPAYEIRGGADTRPLARRTFGCPRGGQPKATSYLRSLRRPGPRFNPTKKKAPGCLCLGLGPCDRTECPKTLLGGFGLWRRSTGRLWAEYSYSVNRATVSLRTESSVFLVTFHMARRPWIPLLLP